MGTDAAVIHDTMADQLRMPRGPLAPLVALSLNQRNHGLIERTIKALGVEAGNRVLDVGFGGGLSLRLLVSAVGDGHVAGVDPSPEMVARARRLLSGHVASGIVSVEPGTVDSVPFPDATFDRVLTCQTVYFWDDLATGLAELRRVLVPGGRLAVAMMPRSLQERFGFVERGYTVLTHEDLIDHLQGSGFEQVCPWPSPGPGPHWIVTAHRPVTDSQPSRTPRLSAGSRP